MGVSQSLISGIFIFLKFSSVPGTFSIGESRSFRIPKVSFADGLVVAVKSLAEFCERVLSVLPKSRI